MLHWGLKILFHCKYSILASPGNRYIKSSLLTAASKACFTRTKTWAISHFTSLKIWPINHTSTKSPTLLLYYTTATDPRPPPPLREQIHFFFFRTEWSSGHSAWMKKKRSLKCARSCGETFRFSNSLVCSNSHTKLYDTVVTYWQSWLAAPWSSQYTQVGLPRGARQAKYVSAWAKRKSNLRSQYWQTAVFLFTPCRVIKKKKKKWTLIKERNETRN